MHRVGWFRRQASVCRGKRQFASKGMAKTAGREFGCRFGKRFRAYHCVVCDRWHLTTLQVEGD